MALLVLYCAVSDTMPSSKHAIGIHGYVCSDGKKQPKSHLPDGLVATNQGYVPDTKQEVNVAIDVYIDVLHTASHYGSSELVAANKLVSIIKEHQSEAIVYIDSPAFHRAVTQLLPVWESKGFVNDANQPIVFAEEWRALAEQLKAINIIWMSCDTSAVYGIQQARYLAAIAANTYHSNPNHSSITSVKPSEYFTAGDKRSPLMYARYALAGSKNPNRYYLSTATEERQLGKHINTNSFSIVELRKPDGYIEAVFTYSKTLMADYAVPFTIQLDTLYKRDVQQVLDRHGKDALAQTTTRHLAIQLVTDGTIIANEIYPTGLSIQGIQIFSTIEPLLDWYINDELVNKGITCHDITEFFYGRDKKNNYALKPEYVVGYKQAQIAIPLDDNNVTFTLLLGSDLPPRNQLKQLEKSIKAIKVLLWQSATQVIRYACIIDSDEGVGIYCNYFANTHYLK